MAVNYDEEYEPGWVAENNLAKSLGWTHKKDYHRDNNEDTDWSSFQKGEDRVWRCIKGKYSWVRAIFRDGVYSNHKYYKTLQEAFTEYSFMSKVYYNDSTVQTDYICINKTIHRLDGPAVIWDNNPRNLKVDYCINGEWTTESLFWKDPRVIEYNANKTIKDLLDQ